MKKRIFIVLLAAAMVLTSCKETTRITEESEKTVEEKIAGIDMNTNRLMLQLTDNITIDACVTPFSYYEKELGIYEFQKELMRDNLSDFVDRVNAYIGDGTITVKDSVEYIGRNGGTEEDVMNNARVHLMDGSAEYMPDSQWLAYYNLGNRIWDEELPFEEKSGEFSEEIKKIKTLAENNYDSLNSFIAYGMEDEQDYEEMKAIMKNGKVYWEESNLIEQQESEFWAFYSVRGYETIGDTGIPLKKIMSATYVNTGSKELPETSLQGYDELVFCHTDNHIQAVFDGEKKLRHLQMKKNVKVDETPLRTARVLDLQQVLSYFYDKMKTSQAKIVVSNIELFYAGVVVEENGKVEDYIYPVWKIHYAASVHNQGNIYINAITGEELGV